MLVCTFGVRWMYSVLLFDFGLDWRVHVLRHVVERYMNGLFSTPLSVVVLLGQNYCTWLFFSLCIPKVVVSIATVLK